MEIKVFTQARLVDLNLNFWVRLIAYLSGSQSQYHSSLHFHSITFCKAGSTIDFSLGPETWVQKGRLWATVEENIKSMRKTHSEEPKGKTFYGFVQTAGKSDLLSKLSSKWISNTDAGEMDVHHLALQTQKRA